MIRNATLAGAFGLVSRVLNKLFPFSSGEFQTWQKQ